MKKEEGKVKGEKENIIEKKEDIMRKEEGKIKEELEVKTLELDVDKVLEYYRDIERDYKLRDGQLVITYDISERLDQYIVEYIEETTGLKNATYDIVHVVSNGLLVIEYSVDTDKK